MIPTNLNGENNMAKELQELGQWKVGMSVLLKKGGGITSESIVPITKITDSREGTIYASNMLFDIQGWQRGGDVWHKSYITPATEEDSIRIRGINARYRLSQVKWLDLVPSKAIEIEKLLNDNGIETRAKKI